TEKITAYRQKESQLAEAASSYERQMGGIETEFENLSRKKENLEEALSGFFIAYGMHKIPNSGILHEFFGMARTIQEISRESVELHDRQKQLIGQIKERQEQIESTIGLEIPEDALYEKLRSEFIHKKSDMQSYETLSARLEQLILKRNDLYAIIQSLLGQRDHLFKEVGVETEEQYYQAYTDFEEKVRLRKQLEDTESQLGVHEKSMENVVLSAEELKMKI